MYQWAQFTCTWRLCGWGAAPLRMLILVYQWAQFTCTWKLLVRSSSSAHAHTCVPVSSVHLYLEAVGEEQLLCACSYLCTSYLSSHVPGGCEWGAAPLCMLLHLGLCSTVLDVFGITGLKRLITRPSRIHILFCSKTIYFSRLSICRHNKFCS